MLHDHFGPVVHRDEYVPKALLHDVADDGLQQRPSADIEHRLGALARQRAEPFAKSTRHDENRIRIVRRLDQLVERLDADQLTAAIEQRKLLDGFLPHQVQPLLARQRRRRRHRGAVHDFGGQSGKLNAAQQAAANVAVGDDTDEAALTIQHQRDLNAAALDRGNGLAHRRLRSDDGFAPGFHGYYLAFRPITSGARWIMQVYRGCEPRRQSPMAERWPANVVNSGFGGADGQIANCAFDPRSDRPDRRGASAVVPIRDQYSIGGRPEPGRLLVISSGAQTYRRPEAAAPPPGSCARSACS